MSSSEEKASNYRKPPVEYRFKKGKSGNPNGRPRKKKTIPSLDYGVDDRLGLLVLEEAIRPISVREGGQGSKMPALQAVIRSMFMKAASGDIRSGRQLLELISRTETARAETALEVLRNAKEHKRQYTPIFDKHAREGLDPPEVYPHPDDIDINGATGEVTFNGPCSKEAAGAEKAIQQLALDSKRRYGKVKALLAEDPLNSKLRREFAELHAQQEILKKISEREVRRQAKQLGRRVAETKSQPEQHEGEDEA